MAKKTKKADSGSEWWWVEARQPNSFGVFWWFPFYNVRTEREAKLTIKALARRGEDDGMEWRYTEPGYDREPDRKRDEKNAAKGICPRCGAGPKKTKKGRSRGFEAFKCLKCNHTWRLAGTRAAPDPATSPSKPSEGVVGSQGAPKKGKKAQKRKEKKGKKAHKD